MADRAEEILLELSQLCEQYKAEVPSNRRAWPESIKSRVFELKSLGLSFVKIAERTGIASQTIYTWRRPERFLPVKVVNPPIPTITVGNEIRKSRQKLTTVTVITPRGFRIEGLDAKSAMAIIERLENQ